MGCRQPIQDAKPGFGQIEPDDPSIATVDASLRKARMLHSIHQLDDAVMLQQQVIGHLADRRTGRTFVTTDGEE